MAIENKKYRDTVFRMLFNSKEHLLELYNALNGTSYTNPNDLTITTLKGNTYLDMRNDVSFILDFELNLYEHQSTICPNLPLRYLYYIAASYRKLVPKKNTYADAMLKIPTPRFIVFYNGKDPMEDYVVYKLSDMFEKKTKSPALDLTVIAYNVNEGHNPEIMNACSTLKGYSLFVSKVRKYTHKAEKNYYSSNQISVNLLNKNSDIYKALVSSAVSLAIDECIQEDILKDFFLTYRQEVIAMSLYECTAEEIMQVREEEKYEIGQQEINDLYAWLFANGRGADVQRAVTDKAYREKLKKEFKSAQ